MSTLVVDTAGIQAMRDSLDPSNFEGIVSDAIAEGAILFEERIRPETPFDTGLLLLSGVVVVEANGVEFENDASLGGRESYASFAHMAGDPRRGSPDGSTPGGYGQDVEEAFTEELGDKTATRIEEFTAKQLEG